MGGTVGDIVKFKKRASRDAQNDKILCKSGFHKWRIDREKRFDVKRGKLVTVYRCTRCGATKVVAR